MGNQRPPNNKSFLPSQGFIGFLSMYKTHSPQEAVSPALGAEAHAKPARRWGGARDTALTGWGGGGHSGASFFFFFFFLGGGKDLMDWIWVARIYRCRKVRNGESRRFEPWFSLLRDQERGRLYETYPTWGMTHLAPYDFSNQTIVKLQLWASFWGVYRLPQETKPYGNGVPFATNQLHDPNVHTYLTPKLRLESRTEL